jgi:D-alanine-D-alanine ligase
MGEKGGKIKMRIAVLMGGTSPERHVSLASGKAVAKGLREAGYEVIEVDAALGAEQHRGQCSALNGGIGHCPPESGQFPPGGHRSVFEAVRGLLSLDIDAVFIALHGVPGEDGTVQGMLELARLPYTGSGVLASSLAMDKKMSKTIFRERGILTPQWLPVTVDSDHYEKAIETQVEQTFGFPVVVKPNDGGSTVGLSVVESREGLMGALRGAAVYSKNILVEQYIPGRELTVSVLGTEALPIIEIQPEHGLYDYECKYTQGKSIYTVPAELPGEVSARTGQMGLKAFEALGCYGFGRADFRLSEENVPYCLEVNTIPGMTETSLVPKAARARGIDFTSLVDRIIGLALEKGTVNRERI